MSDKWIDRISALLAKAESTTPHEAEALSEKAEELMIKYGIEQAVIDARRAKAGGKAEKIITDYTFYAGVYAKSLVTCGYHIAEGLGLKAIRQPRAYGLVSGEGRWGEQLIIVGFESDVEQAKVLIASLQMQCTTALNEWWEVCPKTSWRSSRRTMERQSFISAFGHTAGSRIKKMRARIITEAGTGTELAVRDRSALLNQFVKDEFNLRSGRTSRGGIWGTAAGNTAGGKANVGGESLGNNSQQIGA